MITPSRVGLVVLLAGVAAAFSWALEAARPRASWLALDGPDRVVLPGTVMFRVRLLEPPSPGFLNIDLRWRSLDGEGHGALAGQSVKLPHPGGSEFLFELKAQHPTNLDVVSAAIFLSPTGRWSDRRAEAWSRWIGVDPPPPRESSAAPVLRRLTTYLPEPERPQPIPPAPWLRWTAAGCLLGAAVLLGLRSHWKNDESLNGTGIPVVALGLIIALLAGAAVESLDLGSMFTRWIREIAVDHRLYIKRGSLQRITTILVLATGLGTALWIAFRPLPMGLRVTAVGCFIWFGLAGTASLSLHQVDRLDGTILPGFSILQLGRLGAALLALGGSVMAVRTRRKGDDAE